MLFDIGWSELLLIGVVALVFIGPKDLPRALRVAGYWFRKAQNLSREFQSSVDQMIREAELDEMREQLKKATEFDIEKEFHKTVDPTGELAESIKPPGVPDFFEAAPASSEPLPASAETPASEAAAALPAPAEAPMPAVTPEPQPHPEPATTTEHAVDPVPPAHQPEPPKP
jgi:sec-independent protein translocase protein TatB